MFYRRGRKEIGRSATDFASNWPSISHSKCKYMISPRMRLQPLRNSGVDLERLERMTFLGINLGFGMHAQEVLAPRLTKAVKTFYGFYKMLSSVTCSPKKRLNLLNSYVTSKWRWMAAAVGPTVAVLKQLNAVVTTMLMGILLSSPLDWIARRRAVLVLGACCTYRT